MQFVYIAPLGHCLLHTGCSVVFNGELHPDFFTACVCKRSMIICTYMIIYANIYIYIFYMHINILYPYGERHYLFFYLQHLSLKHRRFALSRIARLRGESCSAEGAPADERGSESSSDRVGGGGWASPGRTHCATSKSPHIPRTHRRRPRPASSARDWDWGTLERRSSDLHPASGKPQSVINPTVSTSIGCSGLDFPLDSSPRHRCHAVCCCCCFLCLLV